MPTLPDGRPAAGMPCRRFPFRFEHRLAPFSTVVGVTPRTAWVDVGAVDLRIRFGPWSLTTPLSNIRDLELTGGYQLIKVVGPPRLSFADRGVTFATNTVEGVCICFVDPVPAFLPIPVMKHTAATVTVAEPGELIEVLGQRAR